jgi:hypothetical protein
MASPVGREQPSSEQIMSSDLQTSDEVVARVQDIAPPREEEDRFQFQILDQPAVERLIDPDGRADPTARAALKERLQEIVRFAAAQEARWARMRPTSAAAAAEQTNRVQNARSRRQAYEQLIRFLEESR